MNCGHLRHVVGAQRRRQDLPQGAGTGVEQGHQMGRGKPARGLLCAGLAEVLLQLLGVGHREAGPIHHEDAVAAPPALVVAVATAWGHEGVGHVAEQALQDAQGESLAGCAEGRIVERLTG